MKEIHATYNLLPRLVAIQVMFTLVKQCLAGRLTAMVRSNGRANMDLSLSVKINLTEHLFGSWITSPFVECMRIVIKPLAAIGFENRKNDFPILRIGATLSVCSCWSIPDDRT